MRQESLRRTAGGWTTCQTLTTCQSHFDHLPGPQDISAVTQESLRRAIAVVPQAGPRTETAAPRADRRRSGRAREGGTKWDGRTDGRRAEGRRDGGSEADTARRGCAHTSAAEVFAELSAIRPGTLIRVP